MWFSRCQCMDMGNLRRDFSLLFAVSYTHLDVYKRQVLIGETLMRAADKKAKLRELRGVI